MKTFLKILSAIALIVVLVAPFLYFAGWLTMAPLHAWLLGATIVWFVCAPPWLWDGKS
jgi:uncharacterized membrane protein